MGGFLCFRRQVIVFCDVIVVGGFGLLLNPQFCAFFRDRTLIMLGKIVRFFWSFTFYHGINLYDNAVFLLRHFIIDRRRLLSEPFAQCLRASTMRVNVHQKKKHDDHGDVQ